MTKQTASLEYRRAATQQASVVGLVIALHDTLTGNLTRAAEAMERQDVEGRCEQLIHGFKVLTQLETMLDMNNGGEAAINISRFYRHLRGQMLAAQFKLDAAILRNQARLVLEVRQAWQQVDSAPLEARVPQPGSYVSVPAAMLQTSAEPEVRASFSCSC